MKMCGKPSFPESHFFEALGYPAYPGNVRRTNRRPVNLRPVKFLALPLLIGLGVLAEAWSGGNVFGQSRMPRLPSRVPRQEQSHKPEVPSLIQRPRNRSGKSPNWGARRSCDRSAST